ncbi:hypothetical protein Gpo141_00010206 [Globisporangium polare]
MAEVAEETNVQAYMEGLSRLDRVVDDSGYAFTALDVVGKELVSLEPIRNYPHLLFVNLAQNQIVDVTPLTELQYLAVDVSQNQISTLQGFQSNSLSSLKINGNSLENLSGLSGLTSLIILEASRNNIENLSSLSGETSKLEHLELQENKISSLDGIESLSALSSLALQQNNIDSLEALEKLSLLPNLSDLELSGNPVAEIENYRLLLILQLPSLKKLDGVVITEDERLATADLKQQREEAEIAASAMEDEA